LHADNRAAIPAIEGCQSELPSPAQGLEDLILLSVFRLFAVLVFFSCAAASKTAEH